MVSRTVCARHIARVPDQQISEELKCMTELQHRIRPLMRQLPYSRELIASTSSMTRTKAEFVPLGRRVEYYRHKNEARACAGFAL